MHQHAADDQLGEPNDALHRELAAKLRMMLDYAPVGSQNTVRIRELEAELRGLRQR